MLTDATRAPRLVAPTFTPDGATRVWVTGVCLDALDESQVVDQVIASSLVGRGGWIATPNVSFLRQAARNASVNALIADATLRVADGMPLIWASRLLGRGALHRVTGSSLIFSLSASAARTGRSVFVVGGRTGAAELAAERLQARYQGLRVVGTDGSWIGAEPTEEELEPLLDRLAAARPDIVLCGFGFPKQERFIVAARRRLPSAWFLGCGAGVEFAAGMSTRAPGWMQRCGLEWVHRLVKEPRRLAARYAADVPFALGLIFTSAWQRTTGRVLVRFPRRVETVLYVPEVPSRSQRPLRLEELVRAEPAGHVLVLPTADTRG